MNDKRSINLAFILDFRNFQESLKKWVKITNNKQPMSVYFSKYFSIVKPIIHRFASALKLNPQNYCFCTDLQRQHLQILKNIYQPLQQFQFCQTTQKNLSLQQFKSIINPPQTNLFRLALELQPKNGQFAFWQHTLNVPLKSIKGTVIHGKGRGAIQLGMPTANIFSPDLHLLSQFPNGIYGVNLTFLHSPQFQSRSFLGACSLGTNPQYENLTDRRVPQIYILHHFQQSFYDAQVQIQFFKIIRFEGKFETFDMFLNAMHNDIWTLKKCST